MAKIICGKILELYDYENVGGKQFPTKAKILVEEKDLRYSKERGK